MSLTQATVLMLCTENLVGVKNTIGWFIGA